VLTALAVMAERDVGALVVIEGGRLVGIVSERDCARKVELLGRSAKDTAIREIRTAKVVYVTPDHRVDQCMAIMRRDRIRHLPVIEGDRVIAVLSNRDVLEEAIAEEEHFIHDLELDRLVMTIGTGSY
jgi:CBS domain-containing protein